MRAFSRIALPRKYSSGESSERIGDAHVDDRAGRPLALAAWKRASVLRTASACLNSGG